MMRIHIRKTAESTIDRRADSLPTARIGAVRTAATALVAIAATSGVFPVHSEPLKPAVERVVRAATFEVVVARLEENETVQYERPLPWDLLPYTQRTDAYLSIGTAFAIGPNEFLTAGHVLSGLFGSSYPAPRLRSADGKVYELDQVLRYSGHEDFVLFSLKDPPRLKPLVVATRPELNSEVHAIGNAMGEGVVIRDGLLTSETPEQQDGRWRWYRFSAAASPGNSGGPLVDSAGRAIGVIVAGSPAENLNFALPMRRVQEAPRHRARMDSRLTYQVPVMPFGVSESLQFDLELPLGLAEFGQRLMEASNGHSDRLRGRWLAEHAERLFPRGEPSRRMFYGHFDALQPRLVRYGEDGQWKPREIAGEITVALPHGGQVVAGTVAETALIQVRRPDNTPLATLVADSRLQMDLALKALGWARHIGPEAIRITSLGAAIRDERHADAYGRVWQSRSWALGPMDLQAVALLLPVPNGYVALMRLVPVGHAHAHREQLKVLANLIYLTYAGSLPQWQEFAQLDGLRPAVFDGIRIEYLKHRRFSYGSPRFELSVEPSLVDIGDRSQLELDFAYFPERDGVTWDVSGLRLLEDLERSITVFVSRRARVPEDIGGQLRSDWARMLRREAPYDGEPHLGDEFPLVRSVFGLPQSVAAKPATEPERLYEVGLIPRGFLSRKSLREMQQELVATFKLHE